MCRHGKEQKLKKMRYDYLRDRSCEHCGEMDVQVLEFDHCIGKKTRCVSNCRSKRAFYKEVSKTRILCIICHTKVSHDQRQASMVQKTATLTKSGTKARKRRLKVQTEIDDEKRKRDGCVLCGFIDYEYLCTLHFDHVDPSTKQFNISDSWQYSQQKREEELKKCRLLCGKCHKLHTDKQNKMKCLLFE